MDDIMGYGYWIQKNPCYGLFLRKRGLEISLMGTVMYQYSSRYFYSCIARKKIWYRGDDELFSKECRECIEKLVAQKENLELIEKLKREKREKEKEELRKRMDEEDRLINLCCK